MSNDEPKKPAGKFAAWKKAVEGKVSSAGGSADVARKALSLNPRLKGDKSTREFMDEVAEARRLNAEAASKPGEARAAPKTSNEPAKIPEMKLTDLAAVLAATQAWVESEERRIAGTGAMVKEALAAVATETKQHTEQSRRAVEALLASVDPGLVSPKTKALLDANATFLKNIGWKAPSAPAKRPQ